jgi:hypothetical protein
MLQGFVSTFQFLLFFRVYAFHNLYLFLAQPPGGNS